MAELPETPNTYPQGVYQIEQEDSVAGGPNGIANRQATQLGNRTRFLKDKVDEIETKDTAQDQSITDLQTRVQTIENDGTGDDATPVRDYWWR